MPLLAPLLLALAPAAQQVRFEAASIRSEERDDAVVYVLEGPRLTGDDLEVRAERATLVLDAARYAELVARAGLVEAEGGEGAAAPRAAPPPPAVAADDSELRAPTWSRKLLVGLGLPEDQELLRELVLDGAVFVRAGPLTLRAARLEVHPIAGTLRAEEIHVVFGSESVGPNGWPLVLRARVLEETADAVLRAEEAELTTCRREPPHYALRLGRLVVEPSPRGGRIWRPARGWLAFGGLRLLPLPTPDFEPGHSFLGLDGVRMDKDRRFGFSTEFRWSQTLELLGQRIDWTFLPRLSSRRGLPLTTVFELGDRDGHARLELFGLRDEGNDVTGLRRSVAREGDFRWRIAGDFFRKFGEKNEFRGILRLRSDALVDPEFFPDDWIHGRDAASEFAVVHRGDDDWGYAGVRPRLDGPGYTPFGGYPLPPGPFPQQLETLPRLQWLGLARTVATLPLGALGDADGEAPLDLGWGADASRLQLRDRDLASPSAVPLTPLPDRERTRLHGFVEATVPFHPGGFTLRPGVRLEGGLWQDDVAGAQEGDRQLTLESFVEANALLVKRFEEGWRHDVLASVRLRSRAGLVEPDAPAAPTLDGLDPRPTGDVVELSLRQFFRSPRTGRTWLDLEVLAPYYPDASEPLPPYEGGLPWGRPVTGDGFGPLELRAVWTPGVDGGALSGLRWEARIRQDLDGGGTEGAFSRFTVRPNEKLFYGFDFYQTQNTPADFAIGSLFGGWRFSEKWAAGFRQSENLHGVAGVRTSYALQYYGHDFLFEFGYTRFQATGDLGLYFNVTPLFSVAPFGVERLARLRWR